MSFLDSLFDSDALMDAATGVADQMMSSTLGLVDKLMSSVMLGQNKVQFGGIFSKNPPYFT